MSGVYWRNGLYVLRCQDPVDDVLEATVTIFLVLQQYLPRIAGKSCHPVVKAGRQLSEISGERTRFRSTYINKIF